MFVTNYINQPADIVIFNISTVFVKSSILLLGTSISFLYEFTVFLFLVRPIYYFVDISLLLQFISLIKLGSNLRNLKLNIFDKRSIAFDIHCILFCNYKCRKVYLSYFVHSLV